MRRMKQWAVITGICTLGGSLTGFVAADADTINAVDAVAAIQQVAPEAVTEAAASGMGVSLPTDAADGIQLAGDDSSSVTIGLPFAQNAGEATESQVPGVVVYDNHNGSSTVPVVRADGTVQINTVIDNANAPKRYDYPIEVPVGSSLRQDADGTVAVVTSDGAPMAVFGDAWAKDANGNAVPTHYEVSGDTLTQIVEHGPGTAYPVIADPSTGVYSYNCVLTNGSS